MKKWEKEIIIEMLSNYASICSDRGCDDTPTRMLKLIPKKEEPYIGFVFHLYNDKLEDYEKEIDFEHKEESILAMYLSYKLKEEIENDSI